MKKVDIMEFKVKFFLVCCASVLVGVSSHPLLFLSIYDFLNMGALQLENQPGGTPGTDMDYDFIGN